LVLLPSSRSTLSRLATLVKPCLIGVSIAAGISAPHPVLPVNGCPPATSELPSVLQILQLFCFDAKPNADATEAFS
jgi:hypothetical protein